MDEKIIKKYNLNSTDDTILFLDIGCNNLSIIKELSNVIILDHHKYYSLDKISNSIFILNPEDFGISGSFYACASSICYIVSILMDKSNVEYSPLALIGIDGDRQVFESINKKVLDDAINNNFITQKYSYKLGDGYLYDIFNESIDPFIGINGNEKSIKNFFLRYGLKNKLISSLEYDEIIVFKNSILNVLKKFNCEHSINYIFGNNSILKNMIINDIHDFSSILTICGQSNNPSLGVSLCYCNNNSLQEAKNISLNIKKKMVSDLLALYNNKKVFEYVLYFYGKNLISAGEIASTIARYRCNSKVIICFNETNDNEIKVSGRCSTNLIKDGVNLSIAFFNSAKLVGGFGGGHDIASGGIIPINTHKKFLSSINDIIKKQINHLKK